MDWTDTMEDAPMGECRACGATMPYSEFAKHLDENPKCRERVQALRDAEPDDLQEVVERDPDIDDITDLM
jgi:phosphoserine phosphatase